MMSDINGTAKGYLLSRDIYYEKYGQQVYVRNVKTFKDYLFNEITFSVLKAFSKTRPCSLDEVVRQLMDEYETEDEPGFKEDIRCFADELEGEGIILPVSDASSASGAGTAVIDEIRAFCMDKRILYELELELTYRCNEKCIHCYVDGFEEDGSELELYEYKKLLDEARGAGCLRVLLTGGEVCMKPEWIEIAQYAASSGMLVDIYSNGLAITDEVFDRICALHPNSLSYSLYGSTAAVHDAITQVPGSFDKTLKSVLMTKCAGIDTYIKTVAIKENVHELEGLFKLGQRIGVEVKPALTIVDTYGGVPRSSHMPDTVQEFQRILRLCKKYAPDVISGGQRREDDLACNAGQCSLAVDPYGNVYACISLRHVLGNVRSRSITDIWNNSERLGQIRKIRFSDVCKTCGSCPNMEYCTICMGRIKNGQGKIPADTCLIAEAARHSAG